MKELFKGLSGIALVGSVLFAFSSCGNSGQNIIEGVEYYPVKIEAKGKWGMVSPSGKMLFEDEFDKQPSPVFDGLFTVEEKGEISIYKASEKPELIIDELTCVGFLSEGVIPTTTQNSRITMINRKGENKFTLMPHNGKEIVSCDPMYSNGLLRVMDEDRKYGYADNSGKIVISPKYYWSSTFAEGVALAEIEIDGEKQSIIIDKKGEQIAKLKGDIYPKSDEFKNGLLIAKRNDMWGFVDTKGEFMKVTGKANKIGEYNKEVFTYMDKNGKWGVMTFDDTQLIRCKYNTIEILSSGNFLVTSDGKTYVINKDDEKILDFEDYRNVSTLSGAFNYVAREGGNYYLFLGEDGKPIGKQEYATVGAINWTNKTIVNNTINSDFFDVEGVSQLISESITEKGIGNNEIGSPMSKYIKNPYDYSYYSVSITDTTYRKEGYRYSITLKVQSNNSVVQYGTNPVYGYTDYSVKEINPSAVVDKIVLTANVKNDTQEDVKNKVINSLTEKGFVKTSENKLSKGEIEIYINTYRGTVGLTLTQKQPKLQENDF